MALNGHVRNNKRACFILQYNFKGVNLNFRNKIKIIPNIKPLLAFRFFF